jgi:uncharacterized protein
MTAINKLNSNTFIKRTKAILMKQRAIQILKIIGKFLLLILIWSGGIATVSYFDKTIGALQKPLSSFLFEFLPLLFILIPSIFLWKFLDKEKISDLGLSGRNSFKNYGIGFLIGLIWIVLTIFGIILTCNVQTNFNIKIGFGLLVVYFIVLLINTIMQEVLCRGYLYKIIEKDFSGNYAIFFTSIFFVLLHPGAIAAGVVGMINVFCAGLVFGYARKITENLFMPIAIHITWNFIDSVLLGTSPLGLYPHLDWLIVNGNELYTGGKDGLGASIITIFTFPILFVIFYFDIFKIQKTKSNY